MREPERMTKGPHPALRATFSKGEGRQQSSSLLHEVEKVPNGRMRFLSCREFRL